MKYSSFDAGSGHYKVYEDASTIPINGDLPVPPLGQELNGIGVPAMDAARFLPSGARYVGDSLAPVGMITRRQQALDGFGDFKSVGNTFLWVTCAAVGVYLVYHLTEPRKRRTLR